jgi:Xaa-Pro aminopeptidase
MDTTIVARDTLPIVSTPHVERRKKLGAAMKGTPAIFFSGLPRTRNYRANTYPFRAESHFLYLTGISVAGAALLVEGDRSTLFLPRPEEDDALWHGEAPAPEALGTRAGVDHVRFTDVLSPIRAATLPVHDDVTAAWQSAIVGRTIAPRSGTSVEGDDARLADAMIELRLRHDEAALACIRESVAITERGHHAGAKALRPGVREWVARAAIEQEFTASGGCPSYGSIVTVHGEVLHMEDSSNVIEKGDLLLVDAGAEGPSGFASDVTRVYPASGRFSPTQRAIYEIVLRANRDAIAMVKPGVRYRDIHHRAARTMVEGLRELGIFTGDVDGLLERNAAAIFFPHGVGHLLGLDVHDMEDLGDRAGYAAGRTRSTRFGEAYLRLDRDLAPGMTVTIEPGFYRVPAILGNEALTKDVGKDLHRDVLERYADVRGIRLEDDVVCTASGCEVLTRAIPIEADEVERWMRS